MPPDVVTMNSRVRFVPDGSADEFDMSLACPKDVYGAGDKLSVLTPVGNALLRGRPAPLTRAQRHLPRALATAMKGGASRSTSPGSLPCALAAGRCKSEEIERPSAGEHDEWCTLDAGRSG
jgi:hypothetical protein